MAESNDFDEDRALSRRLERLRSDLQARTDVQSVDPQARVSGGRRDSSGMALGLRAGSEFVAAIIVGGAIGWGLDRLLSTKPLFLIVFFLLGTVAGVWNVVRATKPLPRAGAADKDGAPKRADDDEDE